MVKGAQFGGGDSRLGGHFVDGDDQGPGAARINVLIGHMRGELISAGAVAERLRTAFKTSSPPGRPAN